MSSLLRSGPGKLPRVAALVMVLTVPFLSACDSLDTFEIWDSKKKVPGDRKPVFPEGVPGVSSGVPPEMVKGYREPEQAGLDPAAAAAEAAAQTPVKPKPRPIRAASKPPTEPKPVRHAAAPAPAAGTPTATAAAGGGAAPVGTAPLPWPTAPR